MNQKRISMSFAAAVFACFLLISIAAVAGESKKVMDANAQKQPSYTEYPGEIGDIARRAEEQVKEVNEAFRLEEEKLDAIKKEQYFEDNKEEPAGSLLSSEDIESLENKRAQNEKTIRTKAGYVIKSLEDEQKVRQKASIAAPGLRTFSQTSDRWTVKGIVFYESKGAAMIAGEVVKENDVVMGAKVLKVTARYVEFEKQGNKWKQAVGEAPPASYWEQPQPSAPNQPSSTDVKPKDKSSR